MQQDHPFLPLPLLPHARSPHDHSRHIPENRRITHLPCPPRGQSRAIVHHENRRAPFPRPHVPKPRIVANLVQNDSNISPLNVLLYPKQAE